MNIVLSIYSIYVVDVIHKLVKKNGLSHGNAISKHYRKFRNTNLLL